MRKMMLVDDDPFSQRMLEDMFRNEWKIINETTIEQITKRLTLESFNLILLNASLRRTDGEMMFDAMHSHSPNVPIVTYTSVESDASRQSASEKGSVLEHDNAIKYGRPDSRHGHCKKNRRVSGTGNRQSE